MAHHEAGPCSGRRRSGGGCALRMWWIGYHFILVVTFTFANANPRGTDRIS